MVETPADKYSQVSFSGTDDGGQLALVLALDVLNGQDCSCLLVYNGSKAGLALDNDVGDTHLSAEGRKVDNQFNWVDIMGNHDQGGLLGLDKGNGVVETVLDEQGLLRFLQLWVRHGKDPSIRVILLFYRQRFLER